MFQHYLYIRKHSKLACGIFESSMILSCNPLESCIYSGIYHAPENTVSTRTSMHSQSNNGINVNGIANGNPNFNMNSDMNTSVNTSVSGNGFGNSFDNNGFGNLNINMNSMSMNMNMNGGNHFNTAIIRQRILPYYDVHRLLLYPTDIYYMFYQSNLFACGELEELRTSGMQTTQDVIKTIGTTNSHNVESACTITQGIYDFLFPNSDDFQRAQIVLQNPENGVNDVNNNNNNNNNDKKKKKNEDDDDDSYWLESTQKWHQINTYFELSYKSFTMRKIPNLDVSKEIQRDIIIHYRSKNDFECDIAKNVKNLQCSISQQI